jgi:hypothetical protein
MNTLLQTLTVQVFAVCPISLPNSCKRIKTVTTLIYGRKTVYGTSHRFLKEVNQICAGNGLSVRKSFFVFVNDELAQCYKTFFVHDLRIFILG